MINGQNMCRKTVRQLSRGNMGWDNIKPVKYKKGTLQSQKILKEQFREYCRDY